VQVTLGRQKLSQSFSYWRGGLGCPILQYLATAGVGTIGIDFDDTIEIHNLH
jgi:adenylyltransferase/sulfurtransferase